VGVVAVLLVAAVFVALVAALAGGARLGETAGVVGAGVVAAAGAGAAAVCVGTV
jgi:hypothetical protein